MNLDPILEVAKSYANDDPRRPEFVSFDYHSRSEHLELWFDAPTVASHIATARKRGQIRESDDQIYDNLTQIVVDAVTKALTEYQDGKLFMELIVENFRSGRDAFTTGTDD